MGSGNTKAAAVAEDIKASLRAPPPSCPQAFTGIHPVAVPLTGVASSVVPDLLLFGPHVVPSSAFCETTDGAALTRAQAASIVGAVAGTLAPIVAKSSGAVGTAFRSPQSGMLANLGVMKAGTCAVPLPRSLPTEDLEWVMATHDMHVVVCDVAAAPRLIALAATSPSLTHLVVTGTSGDVESLAAGAPPSLTVLDVAVSTPAPDIDTDPSSPAMVLFDDSTGRLEPCVVSHEALAARAASLAAATGRGWARYGWLGQSYYSHHLVAALVTWATDGCVVFPTTDTTTILPEAITKLQLSAIGMSASLHAFQVAQHCASKMCGGLRGKLSSLFFSRLRKRAESGAATGFTNASKVMLGWSPSWKLVLAFGTPAPHEHAYLLRAFLPADVALCNVWGTPGAGVVLTSPVDPARVALAVPGIGGPAPGVTLALQPMPATKKDEAEDAVTGRLWIKSPQLAMSETVDGAGWLETGTVAAVSLGRVSVLGSADAAVGDSYVEALETALGVLPGVYGVCVARLSPTSLPVAVVSARGDLSEPSPVIVIDEDSAEVGDGDSHCSLGISAVDTEKAVVGVLGPGRVFLDPQGNWRLPVVGRRQVFRRYLEEFEAMEPGLRDALTAKMMAPTAASGSGGSSNSSFSRFAVAPSAPTKPAEAGVGEAKEAEAAPKTPEVTPVAGDEAAKPRADPVPESKMEDKLDALADATMEAKLEALSGALSIEQARAALAAIEVEVMPGVTNAGLADELIAAARAARDVSPHVWVDDVPRTFGALLAAVKR